MLALCEKVKKIDMKGKRRKEKDHLKKKKRKESNVNYDLWTFGLGPLWTVVFLVRKVKNSKPSINFKLARYC